MFYYKNVVIFGTLFKLSSLSFFYIYEYDIIIGILLAELLCNLRVKYFKVKLCVYGE